MIKNILNFIGTTYKTVNDYGFDNIDPHLVRYLEMNTVKIGDQR